ncbi:MAG: flagellar hook-associated protein FlgK, partial [Bacillaceae bacterium]|nr:flagellar hook-associated protein FlgK [Bacillaceae bacterium]
RQRVNFVETEPFPPASMNRPQIPGQMGTGVEAGSIERVRDSFLDLQYRGENNKLGYWEARADALKKMEEIMNEPSDSGLAKTMDQFWQALQDLSTNPENDGARSVVRQRGQAVVDTFHYLYNSLSQIKQDLANEIDTTIIQINSLAQQISQINKQINEVEPNGYLPNDLYDERDRLVDQLSQLINVRVERVPSGGNSLKIAEGTYKIYLVDSNGNAILDSNNKPIYLVDGSTANTLSLSYGSNNGKDFVSSVQVQVDGNPNPTPIPITSANQVVFPSGKLLGLIESFGYQDSSGNVKGIYPEMMDNLDKLAYTFVKVFNAIHEQGSGLDNTSGVKFFDDISKVQGAAKDIKLSSEIINDLSKIAASTDGKPGNGNNALNLASVGQLLLSSVSSSDVSLIDNINVNLSNLNPPLPLTSGTIKSNYEGWIGKLGVDSQQAERMKDNSEVLLQSVEERRQSVSSVSLDEEMTNMIKFQHAYNASARLITAIDEMLDKIINGMGIVGR